MDAIRGASPRSSNPSTAERFPAQDANQNSDVGTKPRQGGAIAPPSASRSMAPPANGSSIAAPQSGNSNAPANGSSIAAPQTPASNAPSTGSKIAPPQARSQDASQPGSDDALQGRVDGNKLPAERASDSDTARQGGVGENTPPSQGPSDPDDTFQGRINGNALPPERTTPEGVIAPEEPDTTAATDDAADVEATGPTTPTTDASLAVPLAQEALNAVSSALSGEVPPAPELDFSSSTPVELGNAALEATEQVARLITEGADASDIAEAQGVLAAVANQVSENGANVLQFGDFQNVVFSLAILTSLGIQGSPEFDEAFLLDTEEVLQTAGISALSNPVQDVAVTAEEFVAPLIADAVTGDFETSTGVTLTTPPALLDDQGIGESLNDLGIAFAAFGTGAEREDKRGILDVQQAQSFYSGIREQLATDGASPEQLAELDAFITDFAVQSATSLFDPEFSSLEIVGSARELLGRRSVIDGAPNTQIAAIAETNAARDARLDPRSTLSAEDAQLVSDVSAGAQAAEFTGEFTDGNLSIASPAELADLFAESADLLVVGATENDPQATQSGQDLFDVVRDELLARLPIEELPSAFIDTFEGVVANRISNVQEATPNGALQIFLDAREITEAVNRLIFDSVDGPEGDFGIARVREFEGNNGADTASIFVIEVKDDTDGRIGTSSNGHDADVTNVITSQLEDAGQSFSLTNILADSLQTFSDIDADPETRGLSTLQALSFITDNVAESGAPAFVNMSNFRPVTADTLTEGLEAVSNTELTTGLDLSTPITQANISDFGTVIRDVALASIDPNRPEIVEMLGQVSRDWQDLGTAIKVFEEAAAADIDLFLSAPNDNELFFAGQFTNDEGAAGSITTVGNNGLANALESDEFILPGQGEELPTNADGADGIPTGASEAIFYRGGGIDAYAPGVTVSGIEELLTTGASFATPDMLVNAVLGRFNPNTETRITPSGA